MGQKKSPNLKEQNLRAIYYNPKSAAAYSSAKNIWESVKKMVENGDIPKKFN